MIATNDPGDWQAALEAVESHDFYHLQSYHRIAQTRGEGEPTMLRGQYEGVQVALPLLIRDLDGLSISRGRYSGLRDASSVYGYPGPLASDGEISPSIRASFQADLSAWLREQRVVSVFSRLHPILGKPALVSGLGELRDAGATVSIDLALTPEARRAQYRVNHRRNLRALTKSGFTSLVSREPSDLEAFASMYYETMRRVGGDTQYHFDLAYFHAMLAIPDFALVLCRDRSGVAAAGAIIAASGPVGEYHLGATATGFLPMSPMKQVFDQSADWAQSKGCRLFHLGGGLGAADDALFSFKAGFSPIRHRFKTWRWIVDADAYAMLMNESRDASTPHDFFPAYRAPQIRCSIT